MQTRHYITKEYPFAFTNGIQASWVRGRSRHRHGEAAGTWCVEDCGRVVNPMLVDEQVRGGIVQGIGGALYENCINDPEQGNLLTTTLADYLVPMSAEMPEMHVGHVETPTRARACSAPRARVRPARRAPGAVMNAINDALRPLGYVHEQPFTPERILRALGTIA